MSTAPRSRRNERLIARSSSAEFPAVRAVPCLRRLRLARADRRGFPDCATPQNGLLLVRPRTMRAKVRSMRRSTVLVLLFVSLRLAAGAGRHLAIEADPGDHSVRRRQRRRRHPAHRVRAAVAPARPADRGREPRRRRRHDRRRGGRQGRAGRLHAAGAFLRAHDRAGDLSQSALRRRQDFVAVGVDRQRARTC